MPNSGVTIRFVTVEILSFSIKITSYFNEIDALLHVQLFQLPTGTPSTPKTASLS